MSDAPVLFFDLFFTLITPEYGKNLNENDVLGISVEEWEAVAENDELYRRRASGIVKSAEQIIDEIIGFGGYKITNNEKNQIMQLRINRMKHGLTNIDKTVYDVLTQLREKHLRLCIISNADAIDTMFWQESPLYPLFDKAVFSCDAGFLKPASGIYTLAMERMDVDAKNSIFIGDGGSDELAGAKRTGMTTVLTEYFLQRETEKAEEIWMYADYHIKDFTDLLGLDLIKSIFTS